LFSRFFLNYKRGEKVVQERNKERRKGFEGSDNFVQIYYIGGQAI